MNPVSLLIIAVAVTIAIVSGMSRCRVRLRQEPELRVETVFKHTPHLWLTVFLPLLLIAVSLWVAANDELIWSMPFWLQGYYQETIWAVILGMMAYLFAFSVTTYRQFQHPDRQRVIVLAAFLFMAVGFVGFRACYQQPVNLGPPRHSADGHILQSTMSSCAAAAAANIARHYGLPKTEADFAELFQTTEEGTLPAHIAFGFERLGFKVVKRTVTDRDITGVSPPAIVLVTSDTHAVALMNITNGIAHLINPLGGVQNVPAVHFRELWSGHALEIRPGERGNAASSQ